ncbi:MAG TPA: histidine triad nucleotide-binding protein [Spongiibacteraceae bacterium]|nr:histidine triad nucleotide-binding protein [Spongiibacteraceae bacterium]
MTDCLFCKIAAKQIPAKIVLEDDHIVAFRDISPQAPSHILIIPRQHISTVNDAQIEHAALIGHMMLSASRLAEAEGIAQSGYRLVMNCNNDGGQTVYHIHLHLLGGRGMRWPPG